MRQLLDVSSPTAVLRVAKSPTVAFYGKYVSVVVAHAEMPQWWKDWSAHIRGLAVALEVSDSLPYKDGKAIRQKAIQARMRFDRLESTVRVAVRDVAPGMPDDFDIAVYVPSDGVADSVLIPRFGMSVAFHDGLVIAVPSGTDVVLTDGLLVWYTPDGYDTLQYE